MHDYIFEMADGEVELLSTLNNEEIEHHEDISPKLMFSNIVSDPQSVIYKQFDAVDLRHEYHTLCEKYKIKVNALVDECMIAMVAEDSPTSGIRITAPGRDRRVFNNRLDDNHVHVLCTALLPFAPFIIALDLSFNHITDEGAYSIAQLTQHSSQLQYVNIRANEIHAIGAHALASAFTMCKQLRHADFAYNEIGREGGMALASYLQSPKCKLEALILDSSEINIDVIIALSAVLHIGNRTLKVLRIDNPRLSSIQQEFVTHVARMTQINQVLQELRLSRCGIRDDGIETLVSYMFDNRSIRTLDLSMNQIGSKGALAISRLLKSDSAVENLNLRANRLMDDGAQLISDSILYSRCLKYINLNHCSLSDKGLAALAAAVEVNAVLENIRLVHNKFDHHSASAWRSLMDDALMKARVQPLTIDFKTYEVDGTVMVAPYDVEETTFAE